MDYHNKQTNFVDNFSWLSIFNRFFPNIVTPKYLDINTVIRNSTGLHDSIYNAIKILSDM